MKTVQKRILVTGGAGFLGSHLCERLLARGHDILWVDNYFTGRKDNIAHPQQESYRGNVNPIGPRACYDEGKRCAETLFFDYHRQNKVKIRVVRIFNTYGPRMHPNDGLIVQALKNEPITLYGDGSQTRAFCYVDDPVEGFLRMMDAPAEVTGPLNLGNPVETSVAELAQLVIDL